LSIDITKWNYILVCTFSTLKSFCSLTILVHAVKSVAFYICSLWWLDQTICLWVKYFSISGWCGSHLTLELFYFAGRLPFPSIRQNWHKLRLKGKWGNSANEGDEDGMGALCSPWEPLLLYYHVEQYLLLIVSSPKSLQLIFLTSALLCL
jgi:hypothetical protein